MELIGRKIYSIGTTAVAIRTRLIPPTGSAVYSYIGYSIMDKKAREGDCQMKNPRRRRTTKTKAISRCPSYNDEILKNSGIW